MKDLILMFIAIFAIVGIYVLIQYIFDKHLNTKREKVKKKYSELVKEMKEYNIMIDENSEFYRNNVYPLKEEIDNLVENNYIIHGIKECKLEDLRQKLFPLQEKEDEQLRLIREKREIIQAKVDKCDKDINLIWEQTKVRKDDF